MNTDKNETMERFMLFVHASMILVERYDWLKLILAKRGIDIVECPEQLDALPVSANFKGNCWRLSALSMLYEA